MAVTRVCGLRVPFSLACKLSCNKRKLLAKPLQRLVPCLLLTGMRHLQHLPPAIQCWLRLLTFLLPPPGSFLVLLLLCKRTFQTLCVLFSVTATTIVLGNDQVVAIDYFNMLLPPYWNRLAGCDPVPLPLSLTIVPLCRLGLGAGIMLDAAISNMTATLTACAAFDADLMKRLQSAGGDTYATISALAYRQSYASTIMTWNYEREEMWQVVPVARCFHFRRCSSALCLLCLVRSSQFLKEISAGSDLSTVDVIFPAAPLYLLENPLLLWRLLIPLIEYGNNETYIAYNLSWAPHHLGWYPVGNLEPYNQEQMPIEETGNLLLMIAGIAQAVGNVDFIDERYWPLLNNWGAYLWNTTRDPGNQVNLTRFGIVGLVVVIVVAVGSCARMTLKAHHLTTPTLLPREWLQWLPLATCWRCKATRRARKRTMYELTPLCCKGSRLC
jgi:hypothetical protein